MEISRRRFKLAVFAAVPSILIALALVVPILLSTAGTAGALNASEWTRVRGYLNSFIASQYVDGADGEAGFVIDAPALHTRIDSNNDSVFLGEGDDAAVAPVLVDVASTYSTWLPATSVRSNWNSNAMQPETVFSVADRVDDHEAAGFSTDIIVYCATGHTESVVSGGYGAMAQTGALGGMAAPKVLNLKWGRSGWNYGTHAYLNLLPMVAPGPRTPYAYATQPQCNGISPDAVMVRCLAEWALSPSGGNVGSGVGPSLLFKQAVDIRPGPVSQTVNGGIAPSIQVPINSVFGSDLTYLNPGQSLLFVNRTQHTAGMVAAGARMLGYNASFLQWGLPNYNNSLAELYTGGSGYPLVTTQPDTTAPTINSVSISDVTSDSLTVNRQASEPATLKVEYGTSLGDYTGVVNDTILNASKSVTLTGLLPGTKYYLRISSYDGQANGSIYSQPPYSVTTQAIEPCGRPDIAPVLNPPGYWASYADYTNSLLSVDVTIRNRGALHAYGVAITGATVINYEGITLVTPTPATVGNIAAGGTGAVTLQYQLVAGQQYGSLITRLTGSAQDGCGAFYTYP